MRMAAAIADEEAGDPEGEQPHRQGVDRHVQLKGQVAAEIEAVGEQGQTQDGEQPVEPF